MSGNDASIIEAQNRIIADLRRTIEQLSDALDKEENRASEYLEQLVKERKHSKVLNETLEQERKNLAQCWADHAKAKREKSKLIQTLNEGMETRVQRQQEERERMMIAAEISQEKARLKGPRPSSPRTKRLHKLMKEAEERNKERDLSIDKKMRIAWEISQDKAKNQYGDKYNVKF